MIIFNDYRYWQFLILFTFLICTSRTSSAADTLHVQTHYQQTVVTDPSKGFKVYKAWGKFPTAETPIRKIILRLFLGCPDGMRCADWDYNDHIKIRRTGGVGGTSQDYEIARMLTPYGGAFSKEWNFNWEVDVTDFSMLLRDSVEIEYNHTGYEPNEDRGWSVTLDFEIIKGQPAWQPISIQKVYDDTYRYGDGNNNIEKALKPVAFKADPQADFARLRVVQTGHGMDKPDGCGEFCNKYRELWYDGRLLETKNIWKQCGDNPLYPQAGTWVYDRANWCPGNLMLPDIYDLKVKAGNTHTVDINMQPYVSPNSSADEVISAYLIQYKKAISVNDIAIEDVIKPSLKPVYRRLNPSGIQPQIVVKNIGRTDVKSMRIQYGTNGFAKRSFYWKGTLPAGGTTSIILPGIIESKAGQNNFEAVISLPNGKRDAFPADNRIISPFATMTKHDSMLVVYLKTNNQPSQSSYIITNSEGKVIREKAFGSLKENTIYCDTLLLPKDRYQFVLLDSAGNGLEFWANPRGGSGKARLLNSKGQMIKDFESDFGSSIQYNFEVGTPATPIAAQTSFSLYPTRTNDKTTLDYYANFPDDVVVRLIADPGGDVMEEHHYKQLKEGTFTYDLSRFPKGRFYLSVLIGGEEKFKKRIRLKE
ncbi:peptide-N-glycosidase F-related protein [Chitinophagaceae bacterium LB-8]|uniref:Peptide-N-glycosidase F-related protein n=1 Tax=Paraflavisolibacter caeni TaxID=2982496 RepID=A0A9X3B7S9_9BACT|nr:peptide-N-glycosidase F-related protein [Paraflavisolibacter caeni]MCU7548796.1 peptide-N-glycosidase F-related protein [Paraflavisolibacter caeni]